jgi:hypothetical protein
MPADPPNSRPADHAPPGGADFAALVDAIRAAIAEATAVPQLLDGVQARQYLGLSKSAWFRAKSAGLLPQAVFVEGAGDKYRRSDLDKFIERLKPRRKQ